MIIFKARSKHSYSIYAMSRKKLINGDEIQILAVSGWWVLTARQGGDGEPCRIMIWKLLALVGGLAFHC